jgi:hypothetical protein
MRHSGEHTEAPGKRAKTRARQVWHGRHKLNLTLASRFIRARKSIELTCEGKNHESWRKIEAQRRASDEQSKAFVLLFRTRRKQMARRLVAGNKNAKDLIHRKPGRRRGVFILGESCFLSRTAMQKPESFRTTCGVLLCSTRN